MGPRRSLALLPLLVASACLAQTASTSLRGVITDTTGAVVPGATVTLVNPSAGQTLTVNANATASMSCSRSPLALHDLA